MIGGFDEDDRIAKLSPARFQQYRGVEKDQRGIRFTSFRNPRV